MAMKPNIKDRWVKALESGEYSQTNGTLRDNEGGLCCLGVLCEIAVEDGVVTWDSEWNYYRSVEDPEDDYSDGELPEAVVEWAGLDSSNPSSNVAYETRDYDPVVYRHAMMSELNDDMAFDFKQIAEVIKNDPKL